MIIWLTGLSGAGKTTIARAVAGVLPNAVVIDGDEVRKQRPAGFDKGGRDANVLFAAELARKALDAGVMPICALISPFRETRAKVRSMFTEFIEVFADTPFEVCEARDAKGLYARARAGEITDFTGIDSPYEAPENAEIVLRNGTVEEYVSTIIGAISTLSRGSQSSFSKSSGA